MLAGFAFCALGPVGAFCLFARSAFCALCPAGAFCLFARLARSALGLLAGFAFCALGPVGALCLFARLALAGGVHRAVHLPGGFPGRRGGFIHLASGHLADGLVGVPHGLALGFGRFGGVAGHVRGQVLGLARDLLLFVEQSLKLFARQLAPGLSLIGR